MTENLYDAHILLPDDALTAEESNTLDCGCTPDACYCGQYPTREEWEQELLDMELDILAIVQNPDHYPTLAERLAESMKDDRRD